MFDFVDERFDLLVQNQAVATHSWELEVSGLMTEPRFLTARRVPRLSEEAWSLWREGLDILAHSVADSPLADARIILHHSPWATVYRDPAGAVRSLDDNVELWAGRTVSIAAHNILLQRFRDAFVSVFPQAEVIQFPHLRVADSEHAWGLSPFHYIPEYYRAAWLELEALGI
jgi:hypothetical protein